MREEEFMFLGMEPTPLPKDLKQLPQYAAKKTEERRRDIVKHNEKEYQQGLVSIKEKIRQSEGPDMKEQMISQIRQWFLECRDVTWDVAGDVVNDNAVDANADGEEVSLELLFWLSDIEELEICGVIPRKKMNTSKLNHIFLEFHNQSLHNV